MFKQLIILPLVYVFNILPTYLKIKWRAIMKYLTFIIATILIGFAMPMKAEAQLLNRLKKKAQEAAERKAEEKLAEQVQEMAEQMVERSWSEIFGDFSGDSSSGSFPFKMNSNVTTEDTYTFDVVTTMDIQTTDKNGKSEPPVTMYMHFNQNELYTGTRFESEEMKKDEGELFIIYDFKNSAMLMLMQNKKDKFSFAYDWKQALKQVPDSLREYENSEDTPDQWENYTRIGNKDILGYNCDGYKSETDNERYEVWISRNLDYGMQNMFMANANTKELKGRIPEDYPHGMMMEMVSEDLDSGAKTTMKVTDIKKNANIKYVMADYPTMSIGLQKTGK